MQELSLKQLLTDKYPVEVTTRQAQDIIRYVVTYEVRDTNPIALNSPLLTSGVGFFLPKDTAAFFDIFNIQGPAFEKIVKECVSINEDWNVSSNGFNMFCIWLLYRIQFSKLTESLRYDTKLHILKLLNYKFFMGNVNSFFPHGINEGTMQATIDNLTAKCDIKQAETPTWRALIQEHCADVLSKNSVHLRTLETFAPDKKIIYVLSDIHTRIRTKVRNVATAYYKNHAAGITNASKDAMQSNAEGERELRAIKATLDNTIANICGKALNLNSLLNHQHIKLAAAITANVRPDMLRDTLIVFSQMATQQTQQHTEDKVEVIKGQKYYVGYKALITEIIQKGYRHCILSGVDMRSNVKILDTIKNALRASRIADQDILSIKFSIMKFIVEQTKVTREATRVSLRSAIALYFIILSFEG